MFDISNFLYTFLGITHQAPSGHGANAVERRKHPSIDDIKRTFEATTSPLTKYIYLSHWGIGEREKFVATCRKNFLVYIVTVEAHDAGGRMADERQENESPPSPRIDEEVGGQPENIRHEDARSDHQSSTYRGKVKARDAPKHSSQIVKLKESNSKLYRFIRKIMPSKGGRNKDEDDEMFLGDYSGYVDCSCHNWAMNLEGQGAPSAPPGKCLDNYMVPPSSYIEHGILGECTNAEILREIRELTSRIEQSEDTIKDLLLKYVQDGSSEKELSSAALGHNRLLGEIEKRSISIANDHWMQQIEIYKEQQKSLQSTMNSIIHQNRELLEENEVLCKKNEKLSNAVMLLKDNSALSSSPSKSSNVSSRYLLEDLSRNNDRLRTKVNTIMHQVGDMEESIKKFQKRTHFLQQQLNNSNSQLYNSKASMEKAKTEHELHVAKIMNELQASNSVLRECTENGNMIMQDFEMLKMQLQPIAKSISWSKFQRGTQSLPELMRLNRVFINELTTEMLSKHNELNNALKEIDNMKMSALKIKPLREEIHELRAKLDESQKTANDQAAEIKRLKSAIDAGEDKMSAKDEEIEMKAKLIKERDEDFKRLNDMIENSKSEHKQLLYANEKLRHENNALQLQAQGMAQVLTATGAGDIAKELANTQEKLTAIQTQYFALAAENNIMLKQIETNKNERQTLVAYQKNCYEQLQVLHKEIETLEKSHDALKEQLENEKSTVSALQNERVRHLEERTILTAIYERLKAEIAKVDQLEGAVSTMNKKASRLAMIAEYNKQLGEKLQLEVAERDVAINELQNNVKQLNSFQMESTKEKVALCEELNKVFSVKEVLNTKLTAELEKNVILDESKKEIQNSANLQLKEIQAAYNREHTALKNLVEDVKQLVVERDSLVEANKSAEAKCINLMMEQERLVEFIKSLQDEAKGKEDELKSLASLLEKRTSDLETLRQSSEKDIDFLRNRYELVAKQMEVVSKENDNLKVSFDYMQADLSKARSDVEQLRQNEQEYRSSIDDLKRKCADLDEECRIKSAALQQIIVENEELKINAYAMGEKFKCLTQENERMSQDSIRLETMLADKYQTCKMTGHPTPKHVENVLDDISARDEEILVLQDRIREFEERAMEMSDLLQTISENRNAIEMRNNSLQLEIEKIAAELHQSRQQQDELECIIQDMRNRRVVPIEDYQEQQAQFNSAVDQLKSECGNQLQNMAREMNAMEREKDEQERLLAEASSNLRKYKEAHEKLQKAHKVLAVKLFTSVRVLICEKVSLESAQARIKALTDEKNGLLTYKEQQQDELLHYQSQADAFKDQLEKTLAENAAILREVEAAKDMITQLEARLNETTSKSGEVVHLEDAIKDQEQRIASIKSQLDESRTNCDALQEIITGLESTCARIEFEKSEAILRLHELQAKTQTEIKHNDDMKRILQSSMTLIIDMKEKGLITPYVHNELLQSFHDHA